MPLSSFTGTRVLSPPSLEQVLESYERRWKSEGYKDEKQEAQYKEKGRKILADFYEIHIPTYRPPLFVEYSFHLKVDGVPVTGKVDRIDKLKNGRLAIVDYKTGKAFDLDRVKKDSQLTMYQMAAEELLGMEVESLTFYHLPSQTPLTSDPHEENQVEALRKRIGGVAGSIQKGLFDPKPEEWKCRWCDYKPHCPVFRHQYLTGQPVTASPGVPEVLAPEKSEDELLADLVDRYGKMKEQQHELETSLQDLREEIVAILRKHGYLRAFGTSYEASVHVEGHWEFKDKGAVLEALRRHGLYEKVLKPSAPEVQRLMREDNLTLQARKDLESLGCLAEHTSLRVKRIH